MNLQEPHGQPVVTPKSNHGSPILITCLSLAVAALLFVGGLGIGFAAGKWGSAPVANSAPEDGAGGAAAELRARFPLFWEAMDVLYRDFYGELPDSNDAIYAAIRGVLSQVDDPNTSFMTPDEASFFRENLQGSFEGIGARVDWDMNFDTVRIVEPFENQPAWRAGIKRDDLITHVDGETIVGTDLLSAIDKIRGPKGTTVRLTIVRLTEEEPFEVEVVRDRIEIPTIEANTVGGDIAYIRLNTFNENAGDLVRDAVKQALTQNPSALIFDLRGNPGGLLRQAVEVASVFLPKGERVLIERYADGKEDIYVTEDDPVTTELPMVVLVNEASASASEIVAGAIQDKARGQLVGTTTYGKGSVQLPQTLSDGSILRVTIARWFTPADRTIDGEGLTPDVVVELTDEDRQAQRDPQLDKAIELLGGAVEPLPVQ
ncbi:MAG TPA: S41 family peptidase [Chloroflexi bacterium]|nr:S41 family peptidase [Chloroflexota bacterium]